jgi:hypothetical protein
MPHIDVRALLVKVLAGGRDAGISDIIGEGPSLRCSPG